MPSKNESHGSTNRPEPCQFLNVHQVAQRLGMSESKVRRNIREGLIPAYDLSWGTGRPTYGIKPSDLNILLSKYSQPAEVCR